MLTQQQVAQKVLRGVMLKHDTGLDVPDDTLSLPEFLTETTVYITGLFLTEALVDSTDPFEDEVITGGITCCLVANGLGRMFSEPFENIAEEAFFQIYSYAFRKDNAERIAAWNVTRAMFNKFKDQTSILTQIDGCIFRFYENPDRDRLELVGSCIRTLNDALADG